MSAAGTGSTEEAHLARLRVAPFEVVGRFTDASNATLLVRLTDRDGEHGVEDLAVHKPARGERPLWDFPVGTLHRREVAAYEVSRAGGFDLIPPTVLREDGPFGPGSLQRFIDHDPDLHYFHLLEDASEGLLDRLVELVVLDLVLDNADRKAGHVLVEHGESPVEQRLRAVDHGVCLNVEPKLRTVVWQLAGRPVPDGVRERLVRLEADLAGTLGERLAPLLSEEEREVLAARVAALTELAVLPAPTGRHDLPWPLV